MREFLRQLSVSANPGESLQRGKKGKMVGDHIQRGKKGKIAGDTIQGSKKEDDYSEDDYSLTLLDRL